MTVGEFIEWVHDQERIQGLSLADYEIECIAETTDEEQVITDSDDISLSVRFSKVTIDFGCLLPDIEDGET